MTAFSMRALVSPVLALSLLLAACAGGSGDGAAGDDVEVEPTGQAQDAAAEPPAGGAAEDVAAAETTENPKDEAAIALPASEAVAAPADPAPPPPPEPTGPPTEGLPGGRYVQIDAITAQANSYAVEFQPYNFTPLIGTGPEDYHVHFFFDTLEPQNAGTNGPNPGEWFLYDGGSPFTGYTFADRPPAATMMCALVADANHGVTLETGNCVPLP